VNGARGGWTQTCRIDRALAVTLTSKSDTGSAILKAALRPGIGKRPMRPLVPLIILIAAGSFAVAGPLFDTASAIRRHPYSALSDRQEERDAMVQTIRQYSGAATAVTDERVIQAMRHVPRARFVPLSERAYAYRDSPVPIGFGQTISQPYIVALMTQLADVQPGSKVLEVGTGSGYQAAVLYELTDQVYTIEIIAPLAERTRRLFDALGLSEIQAREGDGYYGWEPGASFDRILVTAAAEHIPPPLLRQLKPGGRMVIPVGPKWGNQELLLVTKSASGEVSTRALLPVRFVPLTGGG
jgi:protein-L-isoaspartate(D-aspartate) O-methyltransferase